jgi:hypothetical protein
MRWRRLVAALVVAIVVLAGCTGSSISSRPGSIGAMGRQSDACPNPAPAWDAVSARTGRGLIEGYTSVDSALAGTPVGLYVSTSAARFKIEAYRMGDYAGTAGCLVWTSTWQTGELQPAAAVASGPTDAPSAPWKRTLTIATRGWLAGDYLLRLDAGSPWMRQFVPLVIRSTSFTGRVVLIVPDTTWQAYNYWGTYSLYLGPDGKNLDRARAVTFDRPYLSNSGAAYFLDDYLPFLRLAESLGLSLGYISSVDLQRLPASEFLGAKAIISVGHDEYYSPAMRAALTLARDHGVNLAFFGSNEIYWKIRFGVTAVGGDRLEINYKDVTDPIKIPSLVTSEWSRAPSNDPASSLSGESYHCATATRYPSLVVVDSGMWLFAGTGVSDGTALGSVGGQEFDGISPGFPIPRPMSVLFHSQLMCYGRPTTADSTYYTTSSGAGVLDVGAYYWVCALDNVCRVPITPATQAVVSRVTANFLLAAAAAPLGQTHPAVDNVRQFYPTTPPVIASSRGAIAPLQEGRTAPKEPLKVGPR